MSGQQSSFFENMKSPSPNTVVASQLTKVLETQAGDHAYRTNGAGKLLQESRKLNCPAQAHMREIIKFPEYKISQKTEWRCKSHSKKLRYVIDAGTAKTERWINIHFRSVDEHTVHPTGEAGGLFQRIDERLVAKIQELVCAGARSEKEIRRHLKIFVQRELYRGKKAPLKTNIRFYPSKVTIRSHMYKSLVKERFSKIDQEDLQEKVKLWREISPEDYFEFQPYVTYNEEGEERNGDDDDSSRSDGEEDDEDIILKTPTKGFLFAHQMKDQRRLLERYGNEISMLDATYKTTKYSLPIFFVVVKTNVDYQIVGSFVIQSETSDSIYEALSIIKSWNPTWNPSYFMLDFSEEMSAIGKLFPGIKILS
ncbi:hypothetical protein pdam_00010007 [Pocillopora damicornis]|uniref:ZSWIM1/3 RNaseH-like domain-containing protein n=1 Tax=Pocillopora damicornis TaxID=46731 RepID=A0A3M6T509_POCDA|nr:hypothetical protein pdam_00010007 [Pocillopora damicornis]